MCCCSGGGDIVDFLWRGSHRMVYRLVAWQLVCTLRWVCRTRWRIEAHGAVSFLLSISIHGPLPMHAGSEGHSPLVAAGGLVRVTAHVVRALTVHVRHPMWVLVSGAGMSGRDRANDLPPCITTTHKSHVGPVLCVQYACFGKATPAMAVCTELSCQWCAVSLGVKLWGLA